MDKKIKYKPRIIAEENDKKKSCSQVNQERSCNSSFHTEACGHQITSPWRKNSCLKSLEIQVQKFDQRPACTFAKENIDLVVLVTSWVSSNNHSSFL